MSTSGVKIFPRRKAIGTYFGSDRPTQRYIMKPVSKEPICINVEMIRPYFGLPQRLAAAHLGLSLTALKGVCRKLGIPKWAQARSTAAESPRPVVDSPEPALNTSSADHCPLSSIQRAGAELNNSNSSSTLEASDAKPSCMARPELASRSGMDALHQAFELDVFEECWTLAGDDPMDRNHDLRDENLQCLAGSEALRVDVSMGPAQFMPADHELQPTRCASRCLSQNDGRLFHAEDQRLGDSGEYSGDDLSYLVPFSSRLRQDYLQMWQTCYFSECPTRSAFRIGPVE